MSQRVWTNNEASAHRGLYTNTNNQSTIDTSNVPATQAKSYAILTMIISFPINGQAILIDAIDNTTIKEYLRSPKSLAPKLSISLPESSTAVSQSISTKQATAQYFVSNQGAITINKLQTTVRPLINPPQSLIFLNVSPFVPHEYIEKYLTNINIRMTPKLILLSRCTGSRLYSHNEFW